MLAFNSIIDTDLQTVTSGSSSSSIISGGVSAFPAGVSANYFTATDSVQAALVTLDAETYSMQEMQDLNTLFQNALT